MADGPGIRVWVAGPPVDERPRIATEPEGYFEAPRSERDRLTREVTRVSLLTFEAPLWQQRLLERLLELQPEGELHLREADPLERFYANTAGLEDRVAELPDEELESLWREAQSE
jgi:hypothetical protein